MDLPPEIRSIIYNKLFTKEYTALPHGFRIFFGARHRLPEQSVGFLHINRCIRYELLRKLFQKTMWVVTLGCNRDMVAVHERFDQTWLAAQESDPSTVYPGAIRRAKLNLEHIYGDLDRTLSDLVPPSGPIAVWYGMVTTRYNFRIPRNCAASDST